MSNSSSKLSLLHRTQRGLFLVCITAVLMTAAATPSWAEGWIYNRSVDEMTDRVMELAVSSASDGDSKTRVSFACLSTDPTRQPGLAFFSQQVIDYDSDKNVDFIFRVDQNAAVTGSGSVSSDGTTLFVRGPHVNQIIQALSAKSRVRVRWPVYRSTPALIEIPTAGLRPVLEKMSCIAPLLPPESPPAPARPLPNAVPSASEGSGS